MCCHPALTSSSAIALTLRAVGGLTTAEIAKAFLVPESTMAQRISRAKQSNQDIGRAVQHAHARERADRLAAVLHVLYLIFNEGYTSSFGARLQRTELSSEAIRLARAMHGLLPDESEVAGLLALMLLTDARRPARTGPDGELIPLDKQDRTLWNQAAIARRCRAHLRRRSRRATIGPYQLQAAIAAVHDEAKTSEDTDWPQILALYGLLKRMSDNPMVALNHAIAAGMVHGPRAGLDLLKALDADERLAGHYRIDAVRAHLLEMAGDHQAAIEHYRAAAERTTSIPERNYLISRRLGLRRRTSALRLGSERTGPRGSSQTISAQCADELTMTIRQESRSRWSNTGRLLPMSTSHHSKCMAIRWSSSRVSARGLALIERRACSRQRAATLRACAARRRRSHPRRRQCSLPSGTP